MTKRERIGRNILVFFGSAGIERIGEESPASTIATDTFVLKEIAQLVKDAEEEGEIKSIMVCGGVDERFQPHSRVEIFSISENEWQFAPDLIHPRSFHGIGRIEDHIFIIGGFVKGDGITNSVERFSKFEERVEGDFTNESKTKQTRSWSC